MLLAEIMEALKTNSGSLTEEGHASERGGIPGYMSPSVMSEAMLGSAADFMELRQGMVGGRRVSPHFQRALIQEAMTASDFNNVFGTLLDRSLLARFNETPLVMRQVLTVKSVRDFRDVRRIRVDGGEGLLKEVNRGGEYRAEVIDTVNFDYAVRKYGSLFNLTWEDLVDDGGDLDIFADLPNRLATSARASEESFLTELFWDATGDSMTAFWTGQGGQAIPSVLPFTLENLTTAVGEMMEYVTPIDGNPIAPPNQLILIVPPALMLEAQAVINSIEVRSTEALTSGGARFTTLSPLAGVRIRIIVNPWIPIATTGNGTFGQTTWALFREPSEGTPVGEFGLLRGFEDPMIFIRKSDQQLVAGGDVSPENGSFDRDTVDFKVRWVFGGRTMDSRGAWGSAGQ